MRLFLWRIFMHSMSCMLTLAALDLLKQHKPIVLWTIFMWFAFFWLENYFLEME